MAEEDKKERAKTEEAPEKKGGLVKWIIIGIAILLVLGGGDFVSWETFMKPSEKEAKKENAPLRVELGPTFPLDTFIVNLAGANGERYLKVNMELELKDGKLVPELEKRRPQVRDTILLLLSSKTFDEPPSIR